MTIKIVNIKNAILHNYYSDDNGLDDNLLIAFVRQKSSDEFNGPLNRYKLRLEAKKYLNDDDVDDEIINIEEKYIENDIKEIFAPTRLVSKSKIKKHIKNTNSDIDEPIHVKFKEEKIKGLSFPKPKPKPKPINKQIDVEYSITIGNYKILSHEKGGGGDCFYNVFAYAYEKLTNIKLTVDDLRKQVSDKLENLIDDDNENDIRRIFYQDLGLDIDEISEEKEEKYKKMLDEKLNGKKLNTFILSKNHYATADIDISIISNMYDVKFLVLGELNDKNISPIVIGDNNNKYLIILYSINNNHFRLGEITAVPNISIQYNTISELNETEIKIINEIEQAK